MIINQLIEIDSEDLIIQNLVKVANFLGLTEMYEVVLSAEQLYRLNSQKVAILITEDTAWEVVRMIMSAAVLNFASWKHPQFEVEFTIEGKNEVVTFSRNLSIEQHKEFAEKYFTQARDIFGKYFPNEDLGY